MSWAIPRFDYVVEFAGASHAGHVRPSNDDVWRADPGLGLFAVSDGMGGRAAGEVAARIAVTQIGEMLRAPASLRAMDQFVAGPTLEARRALFEVLGAGAERAHAAVLDSASLDARRHGMGCTLDAALFVANKVLLVHVGDARTYLVRPTTTIQLTHDHTLHGTLVARGVMTPSDHPGSNVLTNAVGRKGSLEVEEVFAELSEGDRLVLCTDGIHAEIKEEAVISELARRGSTDDAAIALVGAALERGGHDNATALIVEVGPRRVNRAVSDAGLALRDGAFAANSPLFAGVPSALVSRALNAAVEVEIGAGEGVPRFFAGDRVCYILLDGRVDTPTGWTLGASSLVYPESLGGGGKAGTLSVAVERTRALRIRADDFREVCESDAKLAAMLYQRLAHMLARTAT